MSKRWSLVPLGALALVAALTLGGCSSQPTDVSQTSTPAATDSGAAGTAPSKTPSVAPAAGAQTATVTKLVIKDDKVGTGPAAKKGDTVTVHYVGWLTDGTKFDSSVDRNQPFTFTIGKPGGVIEGWNQGVAGMKVGGMRELTIPASLGYGAKGAGNGVIPPDATLVFKVQLLSINK